MMGRRLFIVVVAVGVGGVACAGRHRTRGVTRRPTTVAATTKPVEAKPAEAAAAAAGGGAYEGQGAHVTWPGGWGRVKSDDYAVLLKGVGAGREGATVSLDVPELPAHVPGWIPIGMVVNGYEDNLRKQVGGKMGVKDLAPPAVAGGAKVRMVRSEWTDAKGVGMQETAVLMVHGDHVYILRGTSDVGHEGAVRGAMKEMLGSWKWVGK